MPQRISSSSRTVASSVSPDQSDQKVSRRRSSHGKPNRIASMPVVSSIETLSTQSNTSPRGNVSSNSPVRSEEHTSELQSLMRISYAVFCLKNKKHQQHTIYTRQSTHILV